MVSRMTFGEIKQLIKVTPVIAGFVAFGTYLVPDLRCEWFKEFQAKEFESEAEKAIAAYRELKCEAKGRN